MKILGRIPEAFHSRQSRMCDTIYDKEAHGPTCLTIFSFDTCTYLRVFEIFISSQQKYVFVDYPLHVISDYRQILPK